MSENYQRLSIRSVDPASILRLATLRGITRLPMALLIEDAVDLLWNDYENAGYELDEPLHEAA